MQWLGVRLVQAAQRWRGRRPYVPGVPDHLATAPHRSVRRQAVCSVGGCALSPTPTQTRTRSRVGSLLETATLVRTPAVQARARTSMIPDAISGTSEAKSSTSCRSASLQRESVAMITSPQCGRIKEPRSIASELASRTCPSATAQSVVAPPNATALCRSAQSRVPQRAHRGQGVPR